MQWLWENHTKASDLATPLLHAIEMLDQVLRYHGIMQIAITSTVKGPHITGSLHDVGQAVDIRIRNWPDPALIHSDLVNILSPFYDILLEPDHLHIEYQPKPQDLNQT